MSQHSNDDNMKKEYDFSVAERGKHYKTFRQGTNLVYLEPDIAEVFKDTAAVNNALRALINAARGHVDN